LDFMMEMMVVSFWAWEGRKRVERLMFLICERNEGEWKSEVVLWFCSQLNVGPTTLTGLFLFPLIIMWSKLFNFSLINYHLVVKEIGMLHLWALCVWFYTCKWYAIY
jgi:hypothetical protein